MRTNIEGMRIADFVIERGLKLASQEWVPADNEVINANMPPLLLMTPAGAIDILMPASTAALKGLTFIMSNIGAGGAITLKTSGDAAFTTAIVLAAQESAIVWCTGSATAALGWRSIGTAAST